MAGKEEKKRALLFGATGFVGGYLLKTLLENPAYDKVTIVVRRDPGISNPKLMTVVADFHSMEAMKGQIIGDDVFIAIGTTKKKTPDKNEYYQIDHDYPVKASTIARENGARTVVFLSSVGADSGSGVFYLKTKGDTERDIIALGYRHTHIFQPSMIMGKRAEQRPMEKIGILLAGLIGPLLQGGLIKYRGAPARDIAAAMNEVAGKNLDGVAYYQWAEIAALARTR